MKKTILLFTLISLTNILLSQNQEWFTYDLDSLVSIEMPNDVYEQDTIAKGVNVYQIYSYQDNATFLAQRLPIENDNEDENLSKLPYDLKSLKSLYQSMIDGIMKSIPYELESKTLVEKEKFIGYKLKFKDSLNNQNAEGEYYILNKQLYTFFYVNEIDFNVAEKDLFMKSVRINMDKRISQYLGKSRSERIAYLIGKYSVYILFVLGIIYIFRRATRKADN